MNRTRGNEAARTPAIVEDSSLAPPCPQQVASSESLGRGRHARRGAVGQLKVRVIGQTVSSTRCSMSALGCPQGCPYIRPADRGRRRWCGWLPRAVSVSYVEGRTNGRTTGPWCNGNTPDFGSGATDLQVFFCDPHSAGQAELSRRICPKCRFGLGFSFAPDSQSGMKLGNKVR